MTKVKGLKFSQAYENATLIEIQGTEISLIELTDLRKAKEASGRAKDINDLENLQDDQTSK